MSHICKYFTKSEGTVFGYSKGVRLYYDTPAVRVLTSFSTGISANPASYGMTDTMGRMHSDAQFAGSSSVPAHVEMMGFLGIGNNPMVGATVAIAVDIAGALSK